ncbi:WD40/YVTN/BNR-like repeat-containing protein [Spongiibacter tropicus]|uniref:WD40/YVTN/BNR-like repeat-containing protein n=1 Tax=Spongiibacter tropicus TaxID=454602 RepID=UPI0024E1E971|nr:photosystem I reaction center subunit IX [Spongiibacter tropicus]
MRMSFSSKRNYLLKFKIAICGIFFSICAHAGELLVAHTPTDRLYDIDISGSHGYAVGEAGLLMETSDSGKSWSEIDTPTTLALTSVAVTENGAVAVGQLGEVIVNVDWSGWKKVGSSSRMRLLGVDMNSEGLAVAVGAFGTLLRSVDHGVTWKSIQPDWAPLYDSGAGDTAVIRDEPTNYVVQVLEDGRILIGGEYGQILTSVDRGESWNVIYRHTEEGDVIAPTFFDSKFYGNTGYVTGQSGTVLISQDKGMTWKALKTPTQSSLFAIGGDEAGNIFAIGQRVAVVSKNYGKSWKTFNALDISLNWYSGISITEVSDSERVTAVGHGGRIISVNPF